MHLTDWPLVKVTLMLTSMPISPPPDKKQFKTLEEEINRLSDCQHWDGQWPRYTDKKETKIFLIYKEIQNGAVAKSYMTNGLLIFG
jgi:hypothetical protein